MTRELKRKRIMTFVLAAVLVLSFMVVFVPSEKVYASTTKTSVTNTRTEEQIYYGYYTKWYWADGNTTFCLDPTKDVAKGSTVYAVSRYLSNSDTLTKIAYYGYGGPGWDSVKNNLFQNTPEDQMYALCHCAAAYVYVGRARLTGLSGEYLDHVGALVNVFASQPAPPSNFRAFIYNENNPNEQAMLGWQLDPLGNIRLTKTSSNPELTNNNACYSLSGAVYEVYNASGTKVGTITTGEDGTGTLNNILAGEYTVKEVTAPKGFALDTQTHSVTVTSGGTASVNVTDYAQADPVGILLKKQDSGNNSATVQGAASLEGAQFTVKYYAGFYSTSAQLAAQTPVRTWVLKTDADGYTSLSASYKVSGDDFYYASTGDAIIPLGTITIQETKAPTGYQLNNKLFIQQITSNNSLESVTTYNTPIIPEEVIRGGVRVEKWDAESDSNTPSGGATLKGAVFEIVNKNTNNVIVKGVSYAKDTVVATITTDDTGAAATAADLLPYGAYEMREKTPPQGYLTTGTTSRTFNITRNGVVVNMNTSSTAIKNDVIRGDIEGVKVADGTLARMGNVPFRITSKTTGENHVIVTDDNGQFSTASSWNSHSNNTNAGTSSADGVWFGDISALDDNVGALPYDTYIMEELPCEANTGMKLLKFEVKVYRNNVTVDLGTITNDAVLVPEITTFAGDGNGNKEVHVTPETIVIDTVSYKNLNVGEEYTLKGVLMDAETEEPILIDGEEIRAEHTFVARAAAGTEDVEFVFDGLPLSGKKAVVFQSLYSGTVEMAAHADIANEAQTVTFLNGITVTDKVILKTGDNKASALYIVLIICSCAAIAVMFIMLRKKALRKQTNSEN